MRKPTICIGENKDADQLRGNREADQRLCFRYTDSTFPPLLIPKFSRFWVSSVTVQAGLVGIPNCWFSHAQAQFYFSNQNAYKTKKKINILKYKKQQQKYDDNNNDDNDKKCQKEEKPVTVAR